MPFMTRGGGGCNAFNDMGGCNAYRDIEGEFNAYHDIGGPATPIMTWGQLLKPFPFNAIINGFASYRSLETL